MNRLVALFLPLGLVAGAAHAQTQSPPPGGATTAPVTAAPVATDAPATANVAPAPADIASDPRVQQLRDDQRRLDELLAAQQAQLKQQAEQLRILQSATQLPAGADSDGASDGFTGDRRFLAVRPISAGDRDPELLAPLAGYSDRNFFLRDRHSWFVFVPKGRVNIDWYNFLNRPAPPAGVIPNSAADPRSALRDSIFLRRARMGIAGTIARHIDFRVEAEFASLATPGQYATVVDGSVVINYLPWLQLEVGQFYAPLTLENATSENFTDFMEKGAVTRWAVPNTREMGGMIQGILPHGVARYYLGVFDGDGQNFKNLDNKPAVIGRAFIAPLALLASGHPRWLDEIWLGGSFWWQQSDNPAGGQPASLTGATAADIGGLTTEGGFSVISGNYNNGNDTNKNAVRSHLAPDGETVKYAFEANVPLTQYFGLRSEFVHQSIHLRRYDDTNPGTGNLTRAYGPTAFLDGFGAYIEAYAWIGGPVNTDHPGLYQIPHWNGYIKPAPPRWALLLSARYEHVEQAISGLPTTLPSGKAGLDPANGHYGFDELQLGASFWVTRHSRLMANYNLDYIGSGDPRQASALIEKNLFFRKIEHELLFRFQVNL